MIETLVALLESNKQIVLTGAPGTGKTFVARQLAAKLLNGQATVPLRKVYEQR
jgi:MoxR-like ATPase